MEEHDRARVVVKELRVYVLELHTPTRKQTIQVPGKYIKIIDDEPYLKLEKNRSVVSTLLWGKTRITARPLTYSNIIEEISQLRNETIMDMLHESRQAPAVEIKLACQGDPKQTTIGDWFLRKNAKPFARRVKTVTIQMPDKEGVPGVNMQVEAQIHSRVPCVLLNSTTMQYLRDVVAMDVHKGIKFHTHETPKKRMREIDHNDSSSDDNEFGENENVNVMEEVEDTLDD